MRTWRPNGALASQRSGCLLCKPHKLTANVKASRRKDKASALQHERSAW